jgi:pyruvate dehydrogenase E1 component beta subunit
MPIKTYTQAINEALDQSLTEDKNVLVIGEGSLDPSGIFGTTKDLQSKHPTRVFDSPLSENGVTGFCIGAAISGLRPVMVHQRADFSLLAMDQIINNAAKWFSTFGKPCPIVIRMIIGRGWGQGPTHSQSLQSLYAAIPGLKVVMPTSPYDMKGMLIAAIRDPNPVIVLEHRWLFDMVGEVPKESYTVPLDKAKVVREGTDVTVVGFSYATVDALHAAELGSRLGISIEVVDARSCSPIDFETIRDSVCKTERLVIVDTTNKSASLGNLIISQLCQDYWIPTLDAPVILAPPDHPQPTSHFLTKDFYPTAHGVLNTCLKMLHRPPVEVTDFSGHDVPHKNYSITF